MIYIYYTWKKKKLQGCKPLIHQEASDVGRLQKKNSEFITNCYDFLQSHKAYYVKYFDHVPIFWAASAF